MATILDDFPGGATVAIVCVCVLVYSHVFMCRRGGQRSISGILPQLLFVFYVYVCVSACEYENMYAGAQGGQERALSPLELEFTVESHLGTKFQSSK